MPALWAETIASATLALAVPLLLAALGECIAERAGVLNIGLEGLMLAGAFAAVAASHFTGSPWPGVAAAVGASVALALLFGWAVVYRRTNQVVSGTVINLLAYGLTGAFFYTLTSAAAGRGEVRLAGQLLPRWRVPFLADLPALGPTLFHSHCLTYLALIAPALCWVFLSRTRTGLRLRAVGEKPEAAEAAGINVLGARMAATAVSGLFAGLAGASLVVGHVPAFSDNMVGGKGFIALALVIFGRYHPWGIAAGVLFFSIAWGAATLFASQGRGRPEEVLLLALPHTATLIALCLAGQRSSAPAALAQPYPRDE